MLTHTAGAPFVRPMDTSVHIVELEPEAGMTVRPDLLWIAIAARVDDEPPSRALGLLRKVASALEVALKGVHPRASLRPGRLDFGNASTEKTARAGSADVQWNAAATIPLENERELWERAEMAARCVESLSEVARSLSKSKPPVKLHWRNPSPRVSDTEPYRAALGARWNAQRRALLGEGAVPGPSAWDMPNEVIARPVSLEEVRLVLGSIDAAARR